MPVNPWSRQELKNGAQGEPTNARIKKVNATSISKPSPDPGNGPGKIYPPNPEKPGEPIVIPPGGAIDDLGKYGIIIRYSYLQIFWTLFF